MTKVIIMKNNTTTDRPYSLEKEMEELRERLYQSTQTMQHSAKKEPSEKLMSVLIKSTATFEKS